MATKRRHIAYAAHLDSHILSYYAHALSNAYESALKAADISESILAFRPLGLSNIDFAARAFSEIRSRGNCAVVALDIKGFFDSLNHAVLKGTWSTIINTDGLPADHFAIFKSITRFSEVDRSSLYQLFGISENNPKAKNQRVCSAEQFRSRVRKSGLIKTNIQEFGIPQGTPISAVLSNVYMFDFDRQVAEYVRTQGGCYLRYCDDMLIIVQKTAYRKIKSYVCKLINELKLDINLQKTEVSKFTRRRGRQTCDRPLQYLGFTFNGFQVLIRSAALARYSQRMKSGVRLAKATAKRRNEIRKSCRRPERELFKRKLYERYSHLGGRNFVRYGLRAADVLDSPAIRNQLKPLWQRLRDEFDNATQRDSESTTNSS